MLWSHRSTLTLASLREAWSTGPYDAAFLVLVIAWPILLSRHSRRAALVAAVMPLVALFPINVLGAYMAVTELFLQPGSDAARRLQRDGLLSSTACGLAGRWLSLRTCGGAPHTPRSPRLFWSEHLRWRRTTNSTDSGPPAGQASPQLTAGHGIRGLDPAAYYPYLRVRARVYTRARPEGYMGFLNAGRSAPGTGP